MRQRLSSAFAGGAPETRARSLLVSCVIVPCVALAVLAFAPSRVQGQRGVDIGGAIFLLLPVGARTTTSGQSVASPEPSSEQLYWNPSGIARAARREIAFDYGKFFVGPLTSVSGVLPIGRAGVLGASVGVLDFGTQETGDQNGVTGSTAQDAYILAATYSATLGHRASVGFTFKSAQFVGTCSGLCPTTTTFHVSTSAVDAGVQYRVLKDDDLVFGFALRHAGPRFQLNDEPQADPLPTRVQIGVSARLRMLDADLRGAVLRVSADVIDRALELGSAAPRFGAELSWKEQIKLRAGYVAGSGEGTGLAVGVGIARGRAIIDVGEAIGGTGDVDRGSTYLSLRYRW